MVCEQVGVEARMGSTREGHYYYYCNDLVMHYYYYGGGPADVTGFLGTSFLSQFDSNT